MDVYGTHLPILQTISNVISCDSVFEFGMGNFSTKFFAERYQKVIAVEMQEESWYEEVKKSVKDWVHQDVKLLCGIGMTPALEILALIKGKFSLIFVDGHGGNRWQCINKSFGRSDIIVSHDTETEGYNWNLVQKPEEYIWVDVKDYETWTSVLTSNKMVVDILFLKFKRCEIRQPYRF
ncbi:hypothetical protein EBU71_17915 [bacterium]|nr:hypothetical protein [Candidatus Elulimicrobium humile]